MCEDEGDAAAVVLDLIGSSLERRGRSNLVLGPRGLAPAAKKAEEG